MIKIGVYAVLILEKKKEKILVFLKKEMENMF